ncbi:UPF0507 protein [Escovopsis weberi]|uniref:UPF0507 protein n=1 Tax=Escovopsis weberi TaxID=150374 RepID=A0A0M8MYB2_ESCWE|nr:UPF0507 protein [Escovopsis weberi]
MQPLNPFLSAFFKSSVVAQCSPVHHHILLVPVTDVLLTHREAETGASTAEILASEDFLASHVLRVPAPDVSVNGKDSSQNLREARSKAKQYSTVNGKSIVIKEAFIYTNKGFKTLVQSQILNDSTYYPDVFEPRQWLIYYISKPLVGIWEEIRIEPAFLVEGVGRQSMVEQKKATNGTSADNGLPRKKDIASFHDLLNQFPMIARQMQPGLEKLFVEFTTVFQKPLPPPPSASYIPDPKPDGPITTAARRARSNSMTAKIGKANATSLPVTEDFFAEDDEDIMRASLESAVTTAIDIFQGVDKSQLSLLGATTDLTGPLVEKLIERYVAGNVHHLLFAKLSAIKRPEDLELEAKIRAMEYIDISQLGVSIDGGLKAKHDLIIQLGPAVEEFRKISTATSPQDMLDLLLSTMKSVSQLTHMSKPQGGSSQAASEKVIMTVNADTLVSLLLYLVIRSQVRNLQARLAYIRNFIFVEDVESGEMGYALSTFEAVLAYLALDSSGLRRASRRNKALWEATKKADMAELKNIMEPSSNVFDDADEGEDEGVVLFESPVSSRPSSRNGNVTNLPPRISSLAPTATERFSRGTGLSHVFPFQVNGDITDGGPDGPPFKRAKRVAMDTRSLSSASEISFHSRTGSIGTIGSALEGDVSVQRLAQTSNSFGESLLMMAVQSGQAGSLKYLLGLSGYFPFDHVLSDKNNEDTTLLSAAVQIGHTELIDLLLDYFSSRTTSEQLTQYLAVRDIWGRSIGHYLFHAPSLIGKIGNRIPWRQRDKNGQTPLFALCRSYDHSDYYDMVEAGLQAARNAQGDRQPLHIDEHIDGKGNTLLHIINDPRLALRILHYCDVDVNATNDKKFTALMVASKYGRYDMVRALFADPRVDIGAKEIRGLTAVELAKDDDVRNKIDDLGLFSMPPGRDGRITGVVRAFFVDDGSIRLVLKSAAPTDHESYTVTTSRRSLSDFEQLARLLAEENPASWIPSMSDTRWPFQLPSKPSRAVLRDIQTRADWFLKVMLNHPTLSTHEMLWEFFLVPELQLDTMEQRTRLKLETREERIREEFEPVEDMREVEQFVDFARETVRSISYSTKSVTRRANGVAHAASDFYDASALLHRSVTALLYLPPRHVTAMETYVKALATTQINPQTVLHSTLLAIQSMVQALLSSLSRPTNLIGQIVSARREADRNDASAGRTSRWPLGLLDDSRQRVQEEKEKRARKSREHAVHLARELRHTQQTVASELAGWQEMHEGMGRRAIREYAKGMLVQERVRLEGMMRALRIVRSEDEQQRIKGSQRRLRSPSPPPTRTAQKQKPDGDESGPTRDDAGGDIE